MDSEEHRESQCVGDLMVVNHASVGMLTWSDKKMSHDLHLADDAVTGRAVTKNQIYLTLWAAPCLVKTSCCAAVPHSGMSITPQCVRTGRQGCGCRALGKGSSVWRGLSRTLANVTVAGATPCFHLLCCCVVVNMEGTDCACFASARKPNITSSVC